MKFFTALISLAAGLAIAVPTPPNVGRQGANIAKRQVQAARYLTAELNGEDQVEERQVQAARYLTAELNGEDQVEERQVQAARYLSAELNGEDQVEKR
ncbi:hypothetical protein F4782DRAFT_551664 [Xylaria castorea]|nr:hypothetical protein F4782DRAFT_551664 [Xylaria castorea]